MRPLHAGLVALSILAAVPAAANTLAINFSNTTGQPLSNPPFTLGWAFQTTAPVQVTWLSFFDSDQDGLAEDHAIGMWNSTGTLVASATVHAGTADPLHDKFRAAAVAPTLLMPGSYRIGALFPTNSDPNMFPTFTDGFSTAPGIVFLRGAATAGGTLANPTPTFFSMGPAYFGPNFEFQPVPEPGGMAVFGLVAVVAAARLRRRSSTARISRG